ncbi:MAG: DUF1883 domain-containing protein [Flavobacteriales bacterium]
MKVLTKAFEAKKKEIIEVSIDKPTKVKFMTGRDMKAYKMGKTYTYFGGLFEESPVRFVVPYDSMWNVVVEKGTYMNPLAVHASSALVPPNGSARSSIAADAPEHVRLASGLSEEEMISLAAKSEG